MFICRFSTVAWISLALAWAGPAGADTFYVSNMSQVYKVSADGAATPFASGFNVAQAMATDAAGNLYVAGSGDNTIKRVSPAGVVTPFASGLNGPTGIAFDAAGDLFVANVHDQTIRRVSPAGVVTPFATVPAGSGPVGLAFDGAGNLYSANVFGKTISRISPSGVTTTLATVGGRAPQWLTFDATDNALYLSDAGTDEVKRVTLAGGVSTFAAGFDSPEGSSSTLSGGCWSPTSMRTMWCGWARTERAGRRLRPQSPTRFSLRTFPNPTAVRCSPFARPRHAPPAGAPAGRAPRGHRCDLGPANDLPRGPVSCVATLSDGRREVRSTGIDGSPRRYGWG